MLFEIDFAREIEAHGAGNPKVQELLLKRRRVLEQWLKEQKEIPPFSDDKLFKQSFFAFHRPFYESLIKVSARLDEYIKRSLKQQTRPLNVFLNAPPGGGKTSLVRALTSGSDVMEVNLANILSEPDKHFAKLFGKVYKQNEERKDIASEKTPPVVFFDEVDSPGFNFYQYLLMPMADGQYMESGEATKFGAAIFFFAASEKVTRRERPDATFNPYSEWEKEAKKDLYDWCKSADSPKKARDFFSRIDISIFVPGMWHHLCDCKNDNHACLYSIYWQEEELVHLIAAKIISRLEAKSVIEVDRRVFQYIAGAFPGSKRDIDRIVFLSNPRYKDRFAWEDLPHDIIINQGDWHHYCKSLPESFVKVTPRKKKEEVLSDSDTSPKATESEGHAATKASKVSSEKKK